VAAALAANAIEIQQQIKIIDVEKYRTRVSFIQEDLRRSTGVLSNHHEKDAQREENHSGEYHSVFFEKVLSNIAFNGCNIASR
jgi:hypothetical protein